MGLFNKGATLEARLAALVTAIRTGFALGEEAEVTPEAIAAGIKTLIEAVIPVAAARDTALADLAAMTAARDEAVTVGSGLQTQLDAANTAATERETLLRIALAIPTETAINADSIRAAITALAHTEAVNIAASQGCPPVPTEPTQTSASDDPIEQAFEAARAATDPMTRSILFGKAREAMEKKAGKKVDVTGLN